MEIASDKQSDLILFVVQAHCNQSERHLPNKDTFTLTEKPYIPKSPALGLLSGDGRQQRRSHQVSFNRTKIQGCWQLPLSSQILPKIYKPVLHARGCKASWVYRGRGGIWIVFLVSGGRPFNVKWQCSGFVVVYRDTPIRFWCQTSEHGQCEWHRWRHGRGETGIHC